MATNEEDALTEQHVGQADSLTMYSKIIERSPLAMAITSGAQHILRSINAAFGQLRQTETQTLLNQSFGDAFPAAREQDVVALLDRVFRSGEPEVTRNYEHPPAERDGVPWIYMVWPILNQYGQPEGLVLQLHDSTKQVVARLLAEQAVVDLRTVNEQLLLAALREQAQAVTAQAQALHDSLTGLPNRRLLLDRLTQALPSGHRDPSPFALLLVDLDNFKAVNDSLGHPSGDQLLIQMAGRLSMHTRPEDTVARLGGDEFAILLWEISTVSDVRHITDRIHNTLSEPYNIDGRAILSNASIGIVLSTPRYMGAEELMRDVDVALYRAKALGKGRYVIFDSAMHDQAQAQAQLESELSRAIEREEFILHYQPVLSLHSGTIIGVEALVRWQHPVRGSVLPEEFLPVMEEIGLSIPLGEWMLRTACAQMSAWHAAGLPAVYVAVNLSARWLKQRDLAAIVTKISQETGLAPQYLHLELTESSVMEDVTVSIATLQELATPGVHVSVNAFGTGYSSIRYLKRLPLTAVKIDRSFVDDIGKEPNDTAITAAIISMAHRLGLQVIAEGVETDVQLAYLRTEACDAIQGSLVSPVLPATAITQFLSEAARSVNQKVLP